MRKDELFVTLPLMTVGEAARELGVARRVVYQLIEWGELRTVKVQGSLRIEALSVAALQLSGKRF